MPRRSTVTNLMTLLSMVYPNLDSGRQVDVIYTDLKAAFDSLPHGLLLAKLERLGVGEPLYSWIRSFLFRRSYSVRVEGAFSEPYFGVSGVPQGSILSPLLFSLFLNDCVSVLPPKGHLLYADDVKLFFPMSSPSDFTLLQNSLNGFSDWCSSNGLTLCTSKCCVMSFCRSAGVIHHNYSLGSVVLSRVSAIVDLGVRLDSSLSFCVQIDEVVARANSTLGLIARLAPEVRDPRCLMALYRCWVRPILEYAAVVWTPAGVTAWGRLEGVQRRFTRLAVRRLLGYNASPRPPYESRCQLLGLSTLQSRHRNAQAIFIAQLLLHHTDAPDLLSLIPLYVPSHSLRVRPPLLLPTRRTRLTQNDPLIRAMSAFNGLSHLFDYHVSIPSFRLRLIT
uniref:Reverse transcriptase domain-containing protein n=1 Tax=Anopheles atroparvus TaxID=41427 RepID=A0AAG5DP89_ANOAO